MVRNDLNSGGGTPPSQPAGRRRYNNVMFTGIIEEVGRVTGIVQQNGNRRLTVAAAQLNQELKKGDSIAVSGVCLTAVEITPTSFAADLADETWERTSFSRIKKDALVNLELPMRADGRFGGHIVQGHVDGTGKFLALDRIQVPTTTGCESRFHPNWRAM